MVLSVLVVINCSVYSDFVIKDHMQYALETSNIGSCTQFRMLDELIAVSSALLLFCFLLTTMMFLFLALMRLWACAWTWTWTWAGIPKC